jgi:tetratricopeptide (TPR) repeat protein/tRNA A-37 threonylcarbamoyl transferase component Bud32
MAPSQQHEVNSSARHLPSHIGRYRIIRLIGEGGMGAVYQAEQEQPRRTVALKVIKSAWASPELVRRFEQESEVLARLQHPGIAQVYEAGATDTESGPQPYFAMEFIQGQTLCEYAAAHHLSTRARLEIMVKICDAVHHAHQRGIIHRDLKPGNILVDETGQPKILDFGVARMTDADAQATRQTDLGQLIGTLAYMSPEQVLADPLELDTRSDVYALGVILYEFLADRLPYALSRKLDEAVRTIRETDPARLSSISRNYRGDIETIVAKALEKDKTRRYNSAAGLAADVRHYLHDEPITARPPSTTYQLRKFARRNRALVAGVGAVFIVLVAGIVASTWEAVRANRAGQAAIAERDRAVEAEARARAAEQGTAKERDRAVAAEQAANTERNHAVSAQSQAVQERNRAVAEQRRADSEAATAKAVSDFLQKDLLAQASANSQSTPNTKPDPDLKVRTALDRAAARIQGKFDKQPLVEASIRQTIANTYRDLGLYNEAQQQVEQALKLRRQVRGEDHPDTLSAMTDLAGIYDLQGKIPQAQSLYQKVLDVRRRMLGEENPATLSSMNYVAVMYEKQGQYAQAEILQRKALEILTRVSGEENYDTISAMVDLALIYVRLGKFADAEALDIKGVEIMRRVFGEEHPDTLTGMNNLAQVYYRQGKYAQAEELQSKIVETRRRILGPEHNDTLISVSNLAVIYLGERKYAQAETLLTQNLEILLRVFGPDHPNTLTSINNLARVYSMEEKYPEAEQLSAKLVDARRRTLGPRHPQTTDAMGSLSILQLKESKFAEAESLSRATLAILEQTFPDDWTRYQEQTVLGAAISGQKRYSEAEPLLLNGYAGMIERKATIPTRDQESLAQAVKWIVQLYNDSGRSDKAAEWQAKLPSKK